MTDPKKDPSGPMLPLLIVVGFVGGSVVTFMVLDRDQGSLGNLGLIGVILVGLCGGISLNTNGFSRGVFVALASVGAGILAAVAAVMQ